MTARTMLARVICGMVGALLIPTHAERPLEATPAVGVTATVLNSATVREFDAARRYRQPSDDPQERKVWKIELEATRMIEVWTVQFTVQPGGHSGWHTHPGPAVFTVSEGTLTMYEGDDPSCTPQPFPAGTGSIEADRSTHRHLLRNETNGVARTIVTFLVPVGTGAGGLRTDLPNPGNCPF